MSEKETLIWMIVQNTKYTVEALDGLNMDTLEEIYEVHVASRQR